ncbi:hypothetical protein PF005_g23611 [Phytophthora fragariae]|uniref:Uncharacterized protein n=2 Tax=Phytophthora fragariae TaxID=53985 RepID=A0A6A3KAJ3_9STRA|nr:hypothetical protein PF003_g38799 [Phytophthora fragariae]KAE8925425.1 hypothetical protein PF009_g24364 [Phytophthora fragariae]KAE9002567.1 hypothetical protein PF011_g13263 [Phytophthora fragariae]KAE9078966.1 hypothetical protein PF007_g23638 [Phytophthora fragariae]KAE9100445.1 hypothetical protein PF006_g22898 [Phytophthora fragariae]
MSRSQATCRGLTKQGRPCALATGLDSAGWRKFHTPDTPQCQGVAQTTGQRCRVHWDLDSAGYCVHHRGQSPVPASPIPGACKGVTKQGLPCAITWELNGQGFCKYHVPNASRCRGLARTTGRRCKITWNLDVSGYCQFHRRVDAEAARQCVAVMPNSGRRCPQTVGIDAKGFCTVHSAAKAESPLCKGVLFGSHTRCKNNAKPGYGYCCAAHDPEIATSYVNPSVFADSRLRGNVEGQIVKLFRGRDLYHGDKLDLNTIGAVELDHVVEKQCFSFALQNVKFRDGLEEALDVAVMLRDNIVNQISNLCLTRATTNKIKGSAVWGFLDDSMTGHRDSRSFTDYLLYEQRDGVRLGRDVTRTIRNEMGSAFRNCRWKLADEGETPVFDALSAELQRLYVDMELRALHNNPTKPRAVVVAANREDRRDDFVVVESVVLDPWTFLDIKQTNKDTKLTLSADATPFVPGLAKPPTKSVSQRVIAERVVLRETREQGLVGSTMKDKKSVIKDNDSSRLSHPKVELVELKTIPPIAVGKRNTKEELHHVKLSEHAEEVRDIETHT